YILSLLRRAEAWRGMWSPPYEGGTGWLGKNSSQEGDRGVENPFIKKEGRVDFRNNAKGRQRDSKIP
uniref:hypothetical protein n=1 Tax=Segatella hominis TaxID=2518605 RepID=UPI004029502A